MIKKSKETTFKDLIEIFLPKLWLMLLVAVVLCAAISVYTVVLQDDTYTSSSIIYVYNDKGTTTSPSTSDLQAAEQMVNIYKYAITAEKFLKMVCAGDTIAQYNLRPSQVAGMLSFSQLEETAAFRIGVTSTDPRLSYDVALAVTNGIEMYIQGDDGIIKNALLSSVFEDPSIANSPNNKNTVTKAIIAFVVGFALTAVIVWAHSFFDVVIRSAKKIEDNLDIPILGVIPRHEISVTEEGRS